MAEKSAKHSIKMPTSCFGFSGRAARNHTFFLENPHSIILLQTPNKHPNSVSDFDLMAGKASNMDPTPRLLLRPREVADAIGVSKSKAYELIAAGAIPSIKIGGSVRVPLDQLREWIARQLAEQSG
jgi:excisionase family DNA binding protein